MIQDENVKIGAFDATAGDVPSGFNVEGYPTVLFYPANTKKPVPYEGPRETSAMIDYIEKHRSTKKSEEL